MHTCHAMEDIHGYVIPSPLFDSSGQATRTPSSGSVQAASPPASRVIQSGETRGRSSSSVDVRRSSDFCPAQSRRVRPRSQETTRLRTSSTLA